MYTPKVITYYPQVTDANLMLGRLRPEYFPHIFGPGEDEPLNSAATRTKFQDLTNEVNPTPVSP